MRSAKVCLKCGGPVRVSRSREAAGVLRRRLYVCPDGHRYTTVENTEEALAEKDSRIRRAIAALIEAIG